MPVSADKSSPDGGEGAENGETELEGVIKRRTNGRVETGQGGQPKTWGKEQICMACGHWSGYDW